MKMNIGKKVLPVKTRNDDGSRADFRQNKDVWCVSKNNGASRERSLDIREADVGHSLPNCYKLLFSLKTGLFCKVW